MEQCSNQKIIDNLDKTIYGNGRKGLVEEIAIIKEKTETIGKNIDSLATSFAALVKSQVEYDTTQKLKAKTWKQISIIFGISIPLTALILTFKGEKTSIDMKDKSTIEITTRGGEQ
jgi:hypothetical protein